MGSIQSRYWTLMGVFSACAVCMPGEARAGIGYDSLSVFAAPPTQQFIMLPVQADDVSLDPSAGLTLTRVEVLARLRSMAPIAEFNGTMTLRIYEHDEFLPGEILAEATLPLVVARGTDAVVGFDFGDLELPDSTFVVGWYFTMAGQNAVYNDIWVRQNTEAPSVGITNKRYYAGSIGPPTVWGAVSTAPDRNYAIRVTTVPSPAVSVVFGMLLVARRRRT